MKELQFEKTLWGLVEIAYYEGPMKPARMLDTEKTMTGIKKGVYEFVYAYGEKPGVPELIGFSFFDKLCYTKLGNFTL